MTDPFPRMIKVIPEARVGSMSVSHFEVTQEEADRVNLLNALGNPHFDDEETVPGTYVRLYSHADNCTLMTDSNSERVTNLEVVEKARGNVLIAGLGLGMIICPIYMKLCVDKITIVEHSPHVIKLVMPHLLKWLDKNHIKGLGEPCQIRVSRANIHKWKPPRGEKYDTIYFDIWNTPSPDACLEMVSLGMRYQKYLADGGWMAAWREKAAAFDYAEYQSLEAVANKPAEPEWVTKLREKQISE